MKEIADTFPGSAAPSEFVPVTTLEPRKSKFARLLGLALAKSWLLQSDRRQHQPQPKLPAASTGESSS